jgi:hypothetical protein
MPLTIGEGWLPCGPMTTAPESRIVVPPTAKRKSAGRTLV